MVLNIGHCAAPLRVGGDSGLACLDLARLHWRLDWVGRRGLVDRDSAGPRHRVRGRVRSGRLHRSCALLRSAAAQGALLVGRLLGERRGSATGRRAYSSGTAR